MKSLFWFKFKPVLILIVYLIFVVIWGSSLVIMFIEESVSWAIVWLISSVLILVGAALIDCFSKGYKLKYLFFGKKFKKQVYDYFQKNKELSRKEKKKMLKEMKYFYRRFGRIDIVIADYSITPSKLLFEDFHAFNYGNSLDKQKVEYIVTSMYKSCLEGGALYVFYEHSADEFAYDEFEKLIKNSNLFSNELKKFILKKEYKKFYEFFLKYDKLSDEEHEMFSKFETEESDKLYEFESEIFAVAEKIALEKFFDLYEKKGIPESYEKYFLTKDRRKRIFVVKDESLNVFRLYKEKFVFYDLDGSVMGSEGNWCGTNEFTSFYETVELAVNEVKSELDEYDEIK